MTRWTAEGRRTFRRPLPGYGASFTLHVDCIRDRIADPLEQHVNTEEELKDALMEVINGAIGAIGRY